MATGRDEMLRRNQQRNKKRKAEKTKSSKPKRKGLMEVLADYRREEEQSKTYRPKNTPNLSDKAANTKTKTKTAFGGQSLMPDKNPPKPETREKPPESPVKPVKPTFPNEKPNTGSGKDGKFGTGTYGSGRPTYGGSGTAERARNAPNRPKRKDFPPGEKGDKAYINARNIYDPKDFFEKPTERSGTPKPKRSDFTGQGAERRYKAALERWKKSLSPSSNQNNNRIKISAGEMYGGRR